MLDAINEALKNLQGNKAQIDKALAEAEQIAGTFSPDVHNAIRVLLHAFNGDHKVVAQMVASTVQIEKLSKASGEVGAIIAAAQVVAGDESLVEAAQAQATANTEVGNNPLSDAAGGSDLSAADSTSTGETAAAATPAESGQV